MGGARLFWLAKDFIKDTAKSGRTGKTNVSKVREINKSNDRYTTREIGKAVVFFSFWSVFWKYEFFFFKWITHILTNDQKRVRVQTAKQLLQMVPKFNQRKFANIVGKIWVHCFEPVRNVGNKIWPTNYRRFVVAKRTKAQRKSFIVYSSHVIVYPYKVWG